MQHTIDMILEQTQSNTMTNYLEILNISDKQKYVLRQIDDEILDVSIHFTFTSPINVIKNPTFIITFQSIQNSYTLDLQGEFFDYPAYANKLVEALNAKINPTSSKDLPLFSTNSQVATNERIFCIKSTHDLEITTTDYHACLVYGFKSSRTYYLRAGVQQRMTRKMWPYYFRELQVFCPQVYQSTAIKNNDDQQLITRQQYTFQSGYMHTISQSYKIRIQTETLCSGLVFIFTNEDQTQYLDLEGETIRIFVGFTQDPARTEAKGKMRLLMQRQHKQQMKALKDMQEQQQSALESLERLQSYRFEQYKNTHDEELKKIIFEKYDHTQKRIDFLQTLIQDGSADYVKELQNELKENILEIDQIREHDGKPLHNIRYGQKVPYQAEMPGQAVQLSDKPPQVTNIFEEPKKLHPGEREFEVPDEIGAEFILSHLNGKKKQVQLEGDKFVMQQDMKESQFLMEEIQKLQGVKEIRKDTE